MSTEVESNVETPEHKLANTGRPLQFPTGEVLGKAIDKAIKKLRLKNEPLIVENIALELNTSSETLRGYRLRADYRPEFLAPIKVMMDACKAWQVGKLYTAGQAAGPIFALKNNYASEYRDKTEVAAEHFSPDGSMTPKAGKSEVDVMMDLVKQATAKQAETAE